MCPWTSSSNSERRKGSDICYHFILSCLVLFLLYDISFNKDLKVIPPSCLHLNNTLVYLHTNYSYTISHQ
ncbi:hypothetical protein ASPFODRAFT_478742 [Aspergillus luchuensis CBS 106.47]|uniref:Uncharacterized protein n=1 Tax=Aspergillus luchuensis (strain CBS 106.47) TaxID=1137211 RepID=A0A1M3TQR0_ASPLC|nr:hypothetical protein ASPFODRAFT_478742 [Aspergillus luchuensis CBS 106.47]